MTQPPRVTDIRFKGEMKALTELSRDYRVVRLRSLFPGTPLPCDVFLPGKAETGSPLRMARLISAGDVYKTDLHEHLTREGIVAVYIHQDQEDAFMAYTSEYLQSNLLSSSLPPEQKAVIIYDNAENIVKKVFREKPNRANVVLGKQLSNHMATLLTSDHVSVEAMSALFSKDYKTFSHCVQVALLGMAFCQFLGWNAEEVADFGLGALFHDIGKNSIEDEILKKPGKLEKDEFEIMKKHPLLGFQQLKKAEIMSPSQLTVVLHHHEAADGSGYPRGLKGLEIHKYARVGRIVDVFDAITSKRSYKEAVPRDEALRIMFGDMRNGFDPSLLDLFAKFLKMEQCVPQPSQGSRMNIELGCLVHLAIEGEEERFKSSFVGMECDKYLILRVPGLKGLKRSVSEGVKTVGRYIHGGAVYGFRTTVLTSILYPLPLLFLTYPQTVENMNLRQEERIDCLLSSQIAFGDMVFSGVILDLSPRGCKIALKVAEGASPPLVTLDTAVVIKTQFTTQSESRTIKGRVRNIKIDDRIVLGVQFIDMPPEILEQLTAYIRDFLSLVK